MFRDLGHPRITAERLGAARGLWPQLVDWRGKERRRILRVNKPKPDTFGPYRGEDTPCLSLSWTTRKGQGQKLGTPWMNWPEKERGARVAEEIISRGKNTISSELRLESTG